MEKQIECITEEDKVALKKRCAETYLFQLGIIEYFKNKITEKNLNPKDFTINLINVDTPYGEEIAHILKPDFDWQPIRDKGETPFVRGLVMKEDMVNIISFFDKEASAKIDQISGIPVVVVDHGVVEIFSI